METERTHLPTPAAWAQPLARCLCCMPMQCRGCSTQQLHRERQEHAEAPAAWARPLACGVCHTAMLRWSRTARRCWRYLMRQGWWANHMLQVHWAPLRPQTEGFRDLGKAWRECGVGASCEEQPKQPGCAHAAKSLGPGHTAARAPRAHPTQRRCNPGGCAQDWRPQRVPAVQTPWQ